MIFRVVRHRQTDFATYGTLFTEDGDKVGVILELPFVDRDNDGRRDANAGRIQHGRYRVIKRMSPKRGYVVPWLCGVPDVTLAEFPDEPTATTCQMHRAALPRHLLGCLGIGTEFGDVFDELDGKTYPGILGSKVAFEKFMLMTPDEFWIEIVDSFGAPAGSWA